MKKWGLIAAVIVFIMLQSCREKSRYADKQIIRFNIAGGLSSLDPAFARSIDNVNACNQLFNGLVELDKELNLRPAIAKRWEVSEDGKIYRFHLRNDVYYHKSAQLFGTDSSRAVKAEDFVYSFNRLIDKQILSPGKWVMNKVARLADNSLDVRALNDSLLEINLSEAFPPFLGILAMKYCSVVPKEAFETDYQFRDYPIGTGPFQFQYWKDNGKLILLKNQQYFQIDEEGNSLPYVDALAISFIRDQEVVFLKFLKGEFDFISGLKGSYKDELLDVSGRLREKYQEQVRFLKLPYLNTEYLGFQLDSSIGDQKNPMQSVDLRKAINFAIDKEKMLKYLRNDIGYPANSGFIPKGMPPFNDAAKYGYSFNIDSARFYLQKFKTSFNHNFVENPLSLGTTSEYLDICEYVQHQLSSVGIVLKIEVNQAATNNEMIAFGKIPFFRKSWIADYPDAENYLSLFISSNFSPSGPNYTHFSSSTYDSLYSEAMQISNDTIRFQYYSKLDSLIMAEAAVVPLFYDQQVHFTSPIISNLQLNPMSHLMLKYTKKD